MTRLSTKLLLECVAELNYRENEGCGSWRNGVPECLRRAREEAGIPEMTLWVSVVESLVKSQCLMIVSQLDEGTLLDLGIKSE